MRFYVEFDTTNEAFSEFGWGRETARILRNVADKVEIAAGSPNGYAQDPIRDANGIFVGWYGGDNKKVRR